MYGDDFSSKDCITLNADYTYSITYGLMNVEKDGLTGTYQISDSMLLLNANDGSSSGYVLSKDGKICEERDGVNDVFTLK